jgi:hypothetical protein
MSRSVSRPRNTVFTMYSAVDDMDLNLVIEDLQMAFCDAFPSARSSRQWLGREDLAVAENQYAHFGVSVYCGLAAIWCAAKDVANKDFRDNWLAQIETRFRRVAGQVVGTPLRLVGSLSNGSALYERV